MDSANKSQFCDKDRISNLPVHVAHHILSFLTMEELARMCLTSKKHRELCISIPFLTINGIPYRSSAKRAQFINFIDRFLSLRNGMETRQVTICWSFKNGNSDDEYRVLTWLNHAIGCNVKLLELELVLDEDAVFFLPLGVFHCDSLMELKVNLNGGVLKLPSTDGICNIQSLSLRGVQTFDQNFGEWVSSLCKQLKLLSLAHVHGITDISIESSSLQDLTIIAPSTSQNDFCRITISAEMLKKMRLDWRFNSSIGKSLKIYAPNLVTFSLYGSIASSYCLGNLKHLLYASFKFYGPVNTNELSSSQNILELLQCICTVKCLSLQDSTITSRNPRSFEAYGFTRGYWESQNLVFHQLKAAVIELCNKGVNELEFIKFLLKHATVLEKLTVFDPPCFSSEISKVINDYEKVSSAEVVFAPKPSNTLQLRQLYLDHILGINDISIKSSPLQEMTIIDLSSGDLCNIRVSAVMLKWMECYGATSEGHSACPCSILFISFQI
ncbi:unnamed protein product [Dovyalis caffra]|uniref:F-box domain-containing protein n=1 Tax=Dovyalis caffra TaxID=77055 RepID=A0AAV1RY92_9ROSI|nr:unnamed protein product [Dovyalis caffra]